MSKSDESVQLQFARDPVSCTSTTGTLSWTGTDIDAWIFYGDASYYPAPYNYGTYTGSWPGNLVNLVSGTSYTFGIGAVSSDGQGNGPNGNPLYITFTKP